MSEISDRQWFREEYDPSGDISDNELPAPAEPIDDIGQKIHKLHSKIIKTWKIEEKDALVEEIFKTACEECDLYPLFEAVDVGVRLNNDPNKRNRDAGKSLLEKVSLYLVSPAETPITKILIDGTPGEKAWDDAYQRLISINESYKSSTYQLKNIGKVFDTYFKEGQRLNPHTLFVGINNLNMELNNESVTEINAKLTQVLDSTADVDEDFSTENLKGLISSLLDMNSIEPNSKIRPLLQCSFDLPFTFGDILLEKDTKIALEMAEQFKANMPKGNFLWEELTQVLLPEDHIQQVGEEYRKLSDDSPDNKSEAVETLTNDEEILNNYFNVANECYRINTFRQKVLEGGEKIKRRAWNDTPQRFRSNVWMIQGNVYETNIPQNNNFSSAVPKLSFTRNRNTRNIGIEINTSGLPTITGEILPDGTLIIRGLDKGEYPLTQAQYEASVFETYHKLLMEENQIIPSDSYLRSVDSVNRDLKDMVAQHSSGDPYDTQEANNISETNDTISFNNLITKRFSEQKLDEQFFTKLSDRSGELWKSIPPVYKLSEFINKWDEIIVDHCPIVDSLKITSTKLNDFTDELNVKMTIGQQTYHVRLKPNGEFLDREKDQEGSNTNALFKYIIAKSYFDFLVDNKFATNQKLSATLKEFESRYGLDKIDKNTPVDEFENNQELRNPEIEEQDIKLFNKLTSGYARARNNETREHIVSDIEKLIVNNNDPQLLLSYLHFALKQITGVNKTEQKDGARLVQTFGDYLDQLDTEKWEELMEVGHQYMNGNREVPFAVTSLFERSINNGFFQSGFPQKVHDYLDFITKEEATGQEEKERAAYDAISHLFDGLDIDKKIELSKALRKSTQKVWDLLPDEYKTPKWIENGVLHHSSVTNRTLTEILAPYTNIEIGRDDTYPETRERLPIIFTAKTNETAILAIFDRFGRLTFTIPAEEPLTTNLLGFAGAYAYINIIKELKSVKLDEQVEAEIQKGLASLNTPELQKIIHRTVTDEKTEDLQSSAETSDVGVEEGNGKPEDTEENLLSTNAANYERYKQIIRELLPDNPELYRVFQEEDDSRKRRLWTNIPSQYKNSKWIQEGETFYSKQFEEGTTMGAKVMGVKRIEFKHNDSNTSKISFAISFEDFNVTGLINPDASISIDGVEEESFYSNNIASTVVESYFVMLTEQGKAFYDKSLMKFIERSEGRINDAYKKFDESQNQNGAKETSDEIPEESNASTQDVTNMEVALADRAEPTTSPFEMTASQKSKLAHDFFKFTQEYFSQSFLEDVAKDDPNIFNKFSRLLWNYLPHRLRNGLWLPEGREVRYKVQYEDKKELLFMIKRSSENTIDFSYNEMGGKELVGSLNQNGRIEIPGIDPESMGKWYDMVNANILDTYLGLLWERKQLKKTKRISQHIKKHLNTVQASLKKTLQNNNAAQTKERPGELKTQFGSVYRSENPEAVSARRRLKVADAERALASLFENM